MDALSNGAFQVNGKIKQSDFERVRTLIYSYCISINNGKEALVQSRLSKRMRRLGISTFKDYLKLVENQTKRRVLIICRCFNNK